jgi:hypothetical protein
MKLSNREYPTASIRVISGEVWIGWGSAFAFLGELAVKIWSPTRLRALCELL